MRLDKYLKVSRIIKRRTVAKEVADKGRIKVNGILAKSSTDLKVNDQVEIRFGNKLLLVKVLEMKERQKRNRFMGGVLILIMLLFILPTFNLAQSYQQLLQRRQQLADLQTQYQTLSDEKDKETAFATKLKDEDYAAKYTRAKYYYSKSREKVYTIPDLLQR
ncbi:TPA: septum formation initiator family protein [Streptococcus pneumoniae]